MNHRQEKFVRSVLVMHHCFVVIGVIPHNETDDLKSAGAVRSVFGLFVELVKSWNLPDWLVHWGHPANMDVVLFAMGGYGTYLGFIIRFSDDVEERAKAKDLHPKLLAGMFFFFALGATGGITSLLTSDKPILESPHAITYSCKKLTSNIHEIDEEAVRTASVYHSLSFSF
ncbi:PREDICTED: uncharacterized protein LOC109177247 [Ipomoea nil]|uniref:uncharacterized protein LOC109177247 n=1 Tax=Ipomoea nil TaxID=35883 RepID=UPI000901DA2F|nr:PREDICTED: uncharacterized protein LOC109177247 [Ipomoea nil]